VVPTPLPHPFNGIISGGLSSNVNIMGMPAATSATRRQHAAAYPGRTIPKPPSNKAQIVSGSGTVLINGKMAARNGDSALTCNDPVDLPIRHSRDRHSDDWG
jgi:uncharacterized Zn-binding protein involved in type VI secretion